MVLVNVAGTIRIKSKKRVAIRLLMQPVPSVTGTMANTRSSCTCMIKWTSLGKLMVMNWFLDLDSIKLRLVSLKFLKWSCDFQHCRGYRQSSSIDMSWCVLFLVHIVQWTEKLLARNSPEQEEWCKTVDNLFCTIFVSLLCHWTHTNSLYVLAYF